MSTTLPEKPRPAKSRLPTPIRLWFILDFCVALAPPLHWAASGAPIAGAPPVLVYLFGGSAFIAASVVAAYFAEARR